MIELRHLRKEYSETIVPLKDVSVTINDGDIISIIGPSGTGKSTLIRCINLMEQPTSGQILVDGEDITARTANASEIRKKIGMVFQNFNLFAHLTVVENVMLGPMNLLGMSKQEAYDRSLELLHTVGMESRALDYPDMLSGGQKQRVAIARTLAMDPEVILFDEPTSALDPTMVEEVQSVIRDLAKTGKTMMIVTHEMSFAKEISNRVFYMDRGGICEDGSPEQVFSHPENDQTRRFIRRLKIIEIHIDSREFDFRNAITDLKRYGIKNRIPEKTMYRIESVFEELCQQILMPQYEEPDILFMAEYDEENALATFVISYKGEPFDPYTTKNALAFSIIKNQIRSMHYSVDETSEYRNQILIKLH